MKKYVLQALQYLAYLSVAILLFWFVYKDEQPEELWLSLRQANWWWVGVSIAAALFSHWSRGARWQIALAPLGHSITKTQGFISVMAGYFANIFVPRLGEVVRCGLLQRTSGTPLNVSFGAVLAERALDLILLITLTTLTITLEFERLGGFLAEQLQHFAPALVGKAWILLALGMAGMAGMAVLYSLRHRLLRFSFVQKAWDFLKGLKEGLLSIRRFTPKQQALYLLHTINIWLMYFVMGYVLFFCMEHTAGLGMRCGLALLVMGGIGMALPSPGGIGTYHVFVSATLFAYGLTKQQGVSFALLMHGSQSIAMLLTGGASLAAGLVYARKKAASQPVPAPAAD